MPGIQLKNSKKNPMPTNTPIKGTIKTLASKAIKGTLPKIWDVIGSVPICAANETKNNPQKNCPGTLFQTIHKSK